MKKKTTIQDHMQWQMDRAYKGYSEDVDIDSFRKRFEGIPNEACHLLDCQILELHLVHDTFAEVFGVPNLQPSSPLELINLVHEEHMQNVMNLMAATLSNERHFECGKDSISQIFRLKNDRMILKTSTPLLMDSNRHVILVAEQHKDVTDLVGQAYTWSLSGANSATIEPLIRNMFEKELPLTPQEITVLSHIGNGYSSKEAAEVLFISKHTVDTHRRTILKKLGVNNTSEALKQMIELGVVRGIGLIILNSLNNVENLLSISPF